MIQQLGQLLNNAQQMTTVKSDRLRDDFKELLDKELKQVLGQPGTEQRARMENALATVLDESGEKINVEKLPAKQQSQLKKLQTAGEGYEAMFVKQMLTEMRKSSFSEQKSQYGDFAKDTLDQALAEQTAKGRAGIGIAKTIFTSTAPRIVREAAAELLVAEQKKGQN